MQYSEDILDRLSPGGGYESLLALQNRDTPDDGFFKGRQLGNYELTEFVARGGMSEIYLARRSDGAISRDVAIKVSPNSGMSQSLRERFLREQQVLAGLSHENISRLYDVGFTEEGFPYIVMEWIEGIPIDEYCRTHKLNQTAQIELLIKVAQAVQYAHSHLVVHRDIKPSNILVDQDGSPKLLDFGIAKLLESDSAGDLTEHLLPLTPAYASPEQVVGGLISTASDVYQLGAVLHLLVTGENLYGGSAPDLMTLAANQNDLDLPALRDGVDRDIAAIIRKCVRKDPADRYGDISLLIADMQAYLSGYPVTAAKGAQLYRLGKFFARHKLPVVMSCLTGALFIGGSIFYTVNLQSARDLAQQQAQTSSQLLSAMTELITDTYSELLETREERTPSGDLGNEPLRLLLERTNRLIDNTLVKETGLRAELLRLQGATNRQLSQKESAQDKLSEALALAQASQDVRMQIQILTEMILLHAAFTEYEQGQSVIDQAFVLAAELPANSLELADLHDAAATLLTRQDQFERAAFHGEAAIAAYEANPRADPLDLAGSYAQLGILKGRLEQVLEQRALLAKALDLYLQHESPNYRGLNLVYNGIAWSHVVMGEYADAAANFRKSLAVSQANYGDMHPTTAAAHSNVGIALRHQGDLDGALEHLNLSLAVAREMDDAERVVGALLNVGNVYRDLGDLAGAQAAYEEGLSYTDIMEQVPGNRAFFLNNLGNLLVKKGQFEPGLAYLKESLQIKLDVFGEQNISAARTMLALVEGQILAGTEADAAALLSKAEGIFLAQYGVGHSMFAHFKLVAGRYELFRGNLDEANASLSEALELAQLADPELSQMQAVHILHSLAQLHIARADAVQAQVALSRVEEVVAPLSPQLFEHVEHTLLQFETVALNCDLGAAAQRNAPQLLRQYFPARADLRARLDAAAQRCKA